MHVECTDYELFLQNEGNGETIDTHLVKHAVLEAIEDWSESNQ